MADLAQSIEERRQEAYRVALEMYRQQPDWVDFFRELLGVDGVAARLFTKREEMRAFETSEEYRQIQQLLSRLRQRRTPVDEEKEPSRVITVRLPAPLHDALRAEAKSRDTSMNKLCISKLLQVVAEESFPAGNDQPSQDKHQDPAGREVPAGERSQP